MPADARPTFTSSLHPIALAPPEMDVAGFWYKIEKRVHLHRDRETSSFKISGLGSMKYIPLIGAGLWRKPLRTVFTLLSVVIAFLLFGLLQGVNAAFNQS